MPRLKKRQDPWMDLKVLLVGTLQCNHYTMTDVGELWNCHRTTASRKLNNPRTITLDEMIKLSKKLGIPAEKIRNAIPFM